MSTSASLTMLKPLTVWITTNCGKLLKRCKYHTALPASYETCMQVKKQHFKMDIEWWTCSNCESLSGLGILSLCLFNQYAEYLWETLGWMKHKRESRLLRETSITSDMQITPSYSRKQRGTKEPLEEGERGEWKSWLKTQHSKSKDLGIWSITSW